MQINKLPSYVRASWREVRKVVWPTRTETVRITSAVFLFVASMAVVLGAADKFYEWLIYDVVLHWTR